MSRQIFTRILPLGLLAVSFCLLSCNAKSLGDDGDAPAPTIEHLGDCSNAPKMKESCADVCGENSCRNRLQEKSLLPVDHFCFCHKKVPENSASHSCQARTENSTLRDECQQTCANLFDPEGNEYSDYYCSSQNPQIRSNDEHCICVASSSLFPQQDYDYDSASNVQSPRAGGKGKGNGRRRRSTTPRPTNAGSCTTIQGQGSQSAISCQIGSCFVQCPDSSFASFVPPGNTGNSNPVTGDGNDGEGASGVMDNNKVEIFSPQGQTGEGGSGQSQGNGIPVVGK